DLLAAKGADYVLALIDSARPFSEAKPVRTSARSLLLRIAEEAELFIADNECFATFPVNDHQETYSLKSMMFRNWLYARMAEESEQGSNTQAIQETIDTLHGRAYSSGIQKPVFRRIGEADGRIYVDLCDSRWRVVEIDINGWRVLNHSPIKFLRSGGMMALPEPMPGGSLDELREFINVGSDEEFTLMKGWLVQTVRYDVPYTLLALGGEQGSAKSTTANILGSLVDPNKAMVRRPPGDEKDLMATANNGWIITLNNLSSIPVWLSDALCTLAVDGGFAARQLYTNGDEFILQAR